MFKEKIKKNNDGFVAIFPAIIISSILLIISFSLAQSLLSFVFRESMYDQKIQTDHILQSCIDRVLAKKVISDQYRGGETIKINGYICEISFQNTSSIELYVQNGLAESSYKVYFE